LLTYGKNVNYLLPLLGSEDGKGNRRYEQKEREKIWEEAWKDSEVGKGQKIGKVDARELF
jgi:hypothetical protein